MEITKVIKLIMKLMYNICTSYCISSLGMCDNDFTTVSIIMIFLSQYDNYHDSGSKWKDAKFSTNFSCPM